MALPLVVSFVGGDLGDWHVIRQQAVTGASLMSPSSKAKGWATSAKFEDLVGRLRATEEWTYIDRETELRLQR